MINMKDFFKNYYIIILFTLAGAAGGFLHWKYVGCLSGTCVIQSVWYWSTLWGAAAGYLAGDFIAGIIRKRKQKSIQEK